MVTDEKRAYRLLEWDTGFFGFGVAQISSLKLEENQLRALLASLKAQNVRLVYGSSHPLDAPSQKAALNLGGRLVDKKVAYGIDLKAGRLEFPNPAATIREYTSNTPSDSLNTLALECGVYSRFNVDPQITRKRYEDMYKMWLQKSLTKELADVVWVAEQKGEIVGMVTARNKNGEGQIGLLAVSGRMQGQNIGQSLVMAANNWFTSNHCVRGHVVTQGDNIPACKLYEKCGYRIERTEHFFHFWIG